MHALTHKRNGYQRCYITSTVTVTVTCTVSCGQSKT